MGLTKRFVKWLNSLSGPSLEEKKAFDKALKNFVDCLAIPDKYARPQSGGSNTPERDPQEVDYVLKAVAAEIKRQDEGHHAKLKPTLLEGAIHLAAKQALFNVDYHDEFYRAIAMLVVMLIEYDIEEEDN